MQKRSESDWQTLIAAQQSSGLSQNQFCKERKLCSKYFSLRKKQLSGQATPTPFVKGEPKLAVFSMVVLSYREFQLDLSGTSPHFIAEVIKGLL